MYIESGGLNKKKNFVCLECIVYICKIYVCIMIKVYNSLVCYSGYKY